MKSFEDACARSHNFVKDKKHIYNQFNICRYIYLHNSFVSLEKYVENMQILYIPIENKETFSVSIFILPHTGTTRVKQMNCVNVMKIKIQFYNQQFIKLQRLYNKGYIKTLNRNRTTLNL